ncbi:hypothetical protein CR513_12022, partial [Mucuna pruriens]
MTWIGHSNSKYLSKEKICGVMMMATLQLEHDIATFKQDSHSISNLYSHFMNLNVSSPISSIKTLYHHWMHVSMICYVKKNTFLCNPLLKSKNHLLFQWHMTLCFKLSKKKFYNYYKKDRHIIKECPTRPVRRIATAFTTSIDFSIPSSFSNPVPIQQNAPTTVPTLTLKMVQ